MSKSIYRSCKQIYRVYARISKNLPLFSGDSVESVQDMLDKLPNDDFAFSLCFRFPSVWHYWLDSLCIKFGINKSFSEYAILMKAINEIRAHPDYSLAKDYNIDISVVSKHPECLYEPKYMDSNASPR